MSQYWKSPGKIKCIDNILETFTVEQVLEE